ncbi:tetratricopeptide repeat protein [Kineobactrum sediminis]|nr:tetratricopeptide repeat protein [Kineobactrum sediminis]
MQEPDAGTVLGDFNGASFTRRGVTTTFRRDGERFIVRTAGENGTLQDFTVRYVFGVYPLQQYLLPLSRGRLQAFDIAWDSRPAGEGGQRWFHLNPEEVTDHTDPLHWTGPYMNWNLSCAECHSTDLQKRYDPVTRSYDTLFAEIDVACESCHGPGEQHIRLAAKGQLGAGRDTGLETTLGQRGEWVFTANESIARRRQEPTGNAQIDNCGRCHARRGTLDDYHYGKPLLDSHRLALPEPPLYYPDGQIRDEVYVYGSFVQSKMHQAGVVCSNCHEPHSLQLRAEGNGVCAQCHKADVYDQREHHHHTPDSAGAECANCHMPETTYMTVDPRRDHGMRIPRPDLSITTGVPNACNQCHDGQDADWALAAVRGWGIEFGDTASHPARALQQLAAGNRRAMPRLEQLANDNSVAPIMRATVLEALGRAGAPSLPGYATAQLESPEPLLRVSAVRSLAGLPLGQRYQLLKGLVADEITSVRMAVAEALAGVPPDQVSPAQGEQLRNLFGEYTRIQRQHADMPGVQLQLGIFLANRGDLPAAEKAYREALHLNPQLLPARLNLADLLRALQREDEARAEIMAALEVAPNSGAALHALGLLETRIGNREQALVHLQRAAELEQEGVRHRYVYAIALHDSGQPEQALARLEALQRSIPGNEEVLLALVNYSAELGNREKAVRYARELAATAPQNTRYRQLYQRLANTVER